MKKLFILFFGIIALQSLISCSNNDDIEFTAQPDPEGISFVNSTAQSYILTPATRTNIAERFVWNDLDFGTPTTNSYELQGSSEEDFSSFSVVGSTSETNLAVSVGDLMTLATEAGLDNDAATENPNAGTLYFRVRGYAGDVANGGNALEQFSDIMSLNVTLPEPAAGEEEEKPKLYVVGSFLAASGYGADWTAGDAVPLAASATGNTDFEGFVYMNVDEPQFKFLPTTDGFDGDYGDTGDQDGTFSGTIEQEGEVNAGTPDGTGGYYYVKANTGTLNYELTKTDWAITGAATPNGWPSEDDPQGTADQDMTYDAQSKTWSIDVDLTAGEFKFRANDAWDINLGTDEDGDGSLDFGSPNNFSVDTAGNYRVTLDLSNPRQYSYTITLNE